jgi:hypothetical protein
MVRFRMGLIFYCAGRSSHNWKAEMALRFFMCIFEAGYGLGIPCLLSFFYLRHELGLRIGLFLAAAPLANTFAGALAYGITFGHPTFAKWRVLFLVEGLPTIAMAPVTFFFLPDSPGHRSILKRRREARCESSWSTTSRTREACW